MGPNLNLVGIREKSVYGTDSAQIINDETVKFAQNLGLGCEIFQSNWEGALIDKLHESKTKVDGIIINAGALSHYSFSLRDALACLKMPIIEVHMSNIFAREDFRHKSVISEVCLGQIVGLGKKVYTLALSAINDLI